MITLVLFLKLLAVITNSAIFHEAGICNVNKPNDKPGSKEFFAALTLL